MILYVATSNAGKLRDFSAAAANLSAAESHTILPLPGLADIPAPAEDQPTFEGNATLKARYYSLHTPGKVILADDSGLEVDALQGDPGVRSARYADDVNFPNEPVRTLDTRNNLALLQALAALPTQSRTARYRCVLAASRDGEVLATASGTVEGEILLDPRGSAGFGYDPLFFLPEYQCTMAQIDTPTRLAISHRGRAFTALLSTLNFQ